MSRVYHPNNEKVETFDVNVAGTNLLSVLVRRLKLPRANYTKLRDQYDPPYNATAEVAQTMGRMLQKTLDYDLIEIFQEEGLRRLFDGTEQEFVDWVREWEQFLLKCEGYLVP
jgi:hypothetical protein